MHITNKDIGRNKTAFSKINENDTVDADAIVHIYELVKPYNGTLFDTNGGYYITDRDFDEIIGELNSDKTIPDSFNYGETFGGKVDYSLNLPDNVLHKSTR